MKKSIYIVAIILANFLFSTNAVSHPHIFLDTTAKFKMDESNQLKSIVLNFVVDELNTTLTIATLGLDKNGDNKFSNDDKKIVANNVVEGFSHYNFFTYLQINNKKTPLNAPTHAEVDLVNGNLVIAMEIYLSKPRAVSGKTVELKLYDPTYFTEVKINERPQIIGRKKHCKVNFYKAKADENLSKLETSLFQLSREETPELENIGELFSDTTRLVCAG